MLPKRALTALSHAIEDELCARAGAPVLFAAFQRVRFYRAAVRRWGELARTAELAVAFADFKQTRIREHAVCELPLARDAPLRREWALVCESDELSVAMTAWELTYERPLADAERRFETIWTVEPDAVRHVARTAAALTPEALRERARRLEDRPPPPPDLPNAMTLMSRCLAYAGGAQPPAAR